MAVENFIPELWSAKLLTKLETAHVFAAPGVINRDWEGEISEAGDTVHLTGVVDPTIADYTSYTDITVEQVEDTGDTLVIDQAKYFAFEVDDLDKRQAKGSLMDQTAQRAAYKMRDIVDKWVAAKMIGGAGSVLGAATITDPRNAYEILTDLGTALDEKDVPLEGRFAIVPPRFFNRLRNDDRFIANGDGGSQAVRANGIIGSAAGFSLRMSNNGPKGVDGAANLVAGNDRGFTFAEQILKTEGARRELRFGDLLKGLHVYGGKVIYPEALATVAVTIG